MKSKLLSQSINVDENDNDFAHKISLTTQILLLGDNKVMFSTSRYFTNYDRQPWLNPCAHLRMTI